MPKRNRRKKNLRSSTKHSYYIGWALVVTTLLLVIGGFFKGIIDANNIDTVILALLAPGVAAFGISTTRSAYENVNNPDNPYQRSRYLTEDGDYPPPPAQTTQVTQDSDLINRDSIPGEH